MKKAEFKINANRKCKFVKMQFWSSETDNMNIHSIKYISFICKFCCIKFGMIWSIELNLMTIVFRYRSAKTMAIINDLPTCKISNDFAKPAKYQNIMLN